MGKRQTRKKINELIAQFPAIATIQAKLINEHEVLKKTAIHVQRPDLDLMHFQAKNTYYNGSSYVIQPKSPLRATKQEVMFAVNSAHEIIGTLEWYRGTGDYLYKYAKDIFEQVDPSAVEYVVWVIAYQWFEPLNEEESYFGSYVESEILLLVYPRPKDPDWYWEDLIGNAVAEKKEKEEAYLHNPKEMPALPHLHVALSAGCRLRGFSSGGGLRVLRLEKDGKEVGYGEHPSAEEALNHIEEDYAAGSRDYSEVYGKKHPHYLTGSSLSSSNFDHWLKQGHTFECWKDDQEIVVELRGYQHQELPEWVQTLLNEIPAVVWEERGFTFGAQKHPDGGYSMRVLDRPNDRRDDFMYMATQTGRGSDFWQALIAAFAAEVVPVEPDQPSTPYLGLMLPSGE
jgi:hypothetical protein